MEACEHRGYWPIAVRRKVRPLEFDQQRLRPRDSCVVRLGPLATACKLVFSCTSGDLSELYLSSLTLGDVDATLGMPGSVTPLHAVTGLISVPPGCSVVIRLHNLGDRDRHVRVQAIPDRALRRPRSYES